MNQGEPVALLEEANITETKLPVELESKNNIGLNSNLTIDADNLENEHKIKFKDWGFRVDRLFEVAHRFYKRNESKVFHPSFDVRNQMTALTLQARHGNFNSEKAPDIGVLDLVGKNRRYQWGLLNGMSKMEAKSKFICTLDEICPIFKAYAEAVKLSSSGQHGASSDIESSYPEDLEANNPQESDEQLQAIRTSLYRQTYNQFKSYADKQHPDNLEKQKHLITSLQEQYYQQYISQMHPNLSKKAQASNAMLSPTTSDSSGIMADDNSLERDRNLSPSNQVQSNLPNVVSQEGVKPESHEASRIVVSTNEVIANNSNPEISQTFTQNPNSSQSQASYPVDSSINLAYNGQSIDQNVGQLEKPSSQNQISDIVTVTNDYKSQTTRQYQVVDPRLIGKFESFPEPKPIQRPNNGNSLIINMFNSGNSNETKQLKNQMTSLFTATPETTSSGSSSVQPTAPPEQLDLDSSTSVKPAVGLLSHISQEISEQPSLLPSTPPPQQLPPPPSPPPPPPPPEFREQQSVVDTWSCGSSSGAGSPLQQSLSYEPLEQATIWTKKGVNEFKASLIDDKHGGNYLVKQGTLLVIRVPTYPNGKYIYWEFATDEYDVGFGLDFVYDSHLEQPLALKIYEETDEDDEDEEDLIVGEEASIFDQEAGIPGAADQKEILLRRQAAKIARAANTISIVPTYRRDSHEEVFVGRHRYPGQGYYLLKFDNTYSVLRSKSLFFRVCYFI